jgi:hypothetical protein
MKAFGQIFKRSPVFHGMSIFSKIIYPPQTFAKTFAQTVAGMGFFSAAPSHQCLAR